MSIETPDWTRYWRVDEVIECLPLGADDSRVTSALLDADPDAYDDDNYDEDGEVIIEDRTEYRTSATFPKHSLAAIWATLPGDIRLVIETVQANYDR